MLWACLRLLAKGKLNWRERGSGVPVKAVSYDGHDATVPDVGKVKKHIQRLRDRLQGIFGMAGDPLLRYSKAWGWQPRFRISDGSYGK